MKTLMNAVNTKSNSRAPATRALMLLLAGVLLTACGQDAAETSTESSTPAAASKPFVTDAAIKSAQQAVGSAEQRAMAQSVRISEETGKSAAEAQAESARTLKEASRKTDEVLKQAAEDASATSNSP